VVEQVECWSEEVVGNQLVWSTRLQRQEVGGCLADGVMVAVVGGERRIELQLVPGA